MLLIFFPLLGVAAIVFEGFRNGTAASVLTAIGVLAAIGMVDAVSFAIRRMSGGRGAGKGQP